MTPRGICRTLLYGLLIAALALQVVPSGAGLSPALSANGSRDERPAEEERSSDAEFLLLAESCHSRPLRRPIRPPSEAVLPVPKSSGNRLALLRFLALRPDSTLGTGWPMRC